MKSTTGEPIEVFLVNGEEPPVDPDFNLDPIMEGASPKIAAPSHSTTNDGLLRLEYPNIDDEYFLQNSMPTFSELFVDDQSVGMEGGLIDPSQQQISTS
jgi:hypothetical protein